MLKDVVDLWKETFREIGGLKGMGLLFVVMFVFVQVVDYAISRRHVRRAAGRLNAERLRKANKKVL